MSQEDETNFTQSSHRLPTVSAASALQTISKPEHFSISTGLPTLNAVLGGDAANGENGGLVKGHVTEVYGPPGSGKTALGIQSAASALHSRKAVVWIDTAHRIVGRRLADVLSRYRLPQGEDLPSSPPARLSVNDLLENFHHFTAPTLPHLLALLVHPSAQFPPKDTCLIVIDNISTLFATAFPRAIDNYDSNHGRKSDAVQWASGRRWAVMGDFTARMSKMAAVNNIAILLVNQTSTKVKTEHGALLRPALSTRSWLENVNTRLVVFRDFLPASTDQSKQQEGNRGVRFVGVVKHGGAFYESLEKVVPFTIDKIGLHQLEISTRASAANVHTPVILPVITGKRKLGEIADSQSEGEDGLGSDNEFAWIEDDPLALMNEGVDDEGEK